MHGFMWLPFTQTWLRTTLKGDFKYIVNYVQQSSYLFAQKVHCKVPLSLKKNNNVHLSVRDPYKWSLNLLYSAFKGLNKSTETFLLLFSRLNIM